MSAYSDDFSDGVLDPIWTFVGPAGTSASLGTNETDGYVELVTPDGDHDLGSGYNDTARVMQSIDDDDFQLETRFLTTPTQKYQMQGFLIQEDTNNWIRFDTYWDGSKLRAYSAVTIDGVSTTMFNVVISGGSAPYLSVDRVGDTWTFRYSVDGDNWATAGSYTHAMTVTEVGVFAGNTGQADGYTAQVDYFESSSDPIVDEDGTITPVNQPPVAGDDALSTDQDAPLTVDVASDLLGNDTDGDGDPLSLDGFTQPANGTLTDNGDGTLTYTPDAGYSGTDSFTYTVTDGTSTDEATVEVTVAAPPPPQSSAASDDFSDGVLDAMWTFVGPAGTSANLATTATDGFAELVTPDGDHNIWGASNNAARIMQAVSDGDFQIETRFLSTPTQQYEMQGLLVESDANNWIRFDTHWDGSNLRAFAAVTINGSSSAKINAVISGGSAPYLRVDRAGDTYTFEYSTDGSNWTTAGSFSQAMTISQVGVFAGNTGQSDGYVAQVDYFESSSDPIADEDGTITTVNQPPVAADDALSTDQDAPLTVDVASDLLGNDTDGDGDPLSLDGFSQPANGTLTDNGDGTLTYTPDAGYSGTDSFTYTVTDGTSTDEATAEVTVVAPPPPQSSVASDDFSDGVLDAIWSFVGPAGTSADLATTATEAFVQLATPDGDHNIWNGANNAARIMQAVPDGDFQIETRFLSTPTQKYQMQGLLVEADADNWIRFDAHADGSNLRAFAAVTVNGVSSTAINVVIAGGSAPYLRVDRAGDTYTFEYSTDGSNWTTAGSFTQAMTISQVGVFAGNTGQATGYTALVDYFESSSDPIADEDGTITPVNVAPVANDDSMDADQGVPVTFAIADLLANDTDANEDLLSLVDFTQPLQGTLVDNGDGTLTYTPPPDFVHTDTFSYTITDGEFQDTATVTMVGPPPPPFVSDDFSGETLAPVWSFDGEAGTSAALQTAGVEAFVALTVPVGDYNIWGAQRGARLLQVAPDEDFQAEVAFLSTPTERYQMQGIVVEEDADTWIRFDTYFDGTGLRAFAAVTNDGSSSARFNVVIEGGTAPFLRVTRAGDNWTFDYSTDGTNWTTAGSFTQALSVTAVGPLAGATDNAPGFVAKVDYFENAATPIADDDVFAVDDSLATIPNQAIVISINDDLLGNDAHPDSGPFTWDGYTLTQHGTLVDNGDGTLTYTPPTDFIGTDTFAYTVADGSGEPYDEATVTITVGNVPPTAVDDNVTLAEDGFVTLDVLANDSDGNGDALSLVSAGPAANGDVTINPDGTVTYTPNADFYGTDTFTYEVSDGEATSTGTVIAEVTPVADAPRANADRIFGEPGLPVTVAITSLLANDYDPDGDEISFTGFTQPAHGAVVDNGDGTLTYTPEPGFDDLDSFTYSIIDETGLTDTATVLVGVPIDVWYGDEQTFGVPGEAQRWVNIHGNADPSVFESLSYSLNGGPEVELRIGADTRRLQNPGDFNADIDYAALDGSPADDVVTIIGHLASGETLSKDVIIHYESGNDWSPNYSIDWETVTNLQDVAQVVDGKWSFSDAGLRVVEPGYDRFVALGDKNWDNYELNVAITMHDLQSVDPLGRDGGVFGLGMMWTGHTDDPIATTSPKSGYFPVELFTWTQADGQPTFYMYAESGTFKPFALEEDETYNFTVRVEQAGPLGHTYKLKVWHVDDAEPASWLIDHEIQYEAPSTGSALLLTHYYDVSFGDVTVEEIPGHDIVTAWADGGPLLAVDPTVANPGLGETDVLRGDIGGDLFILGEDGLDFYDDGNAASSGEADYGTVWDFDPVLDQIQLAGFETDYVLASVPTGAPDGTAIYRLKPGEVDELIGVVANQFGMSLSSDDFFYDGLTA